MSWNFILKAGVLPCELKCCVVRWSAGLYDHDIECCPFILSVVNNSEHVCCLVTC